MSFAKCKRVGIVSVRVFRYQVMKMESGRKYTNISICYVIFRMSDSMKGVRIQYSVT